MTYPLESRRRRAGSLLAVASAIAGVVSCSPGASTGTTFELSGVYTATSADAGADADPLTPTGDVLRFQADRYSIHHVPCTTEIDPGDADVPSDMTIQDGCTSFGTFSISADGGALSMTDDATGATSILPFHVEESVPIDGGSQGASTELHTLGGSGLLGDSGSLSSPLGLLVQRVVSLFTAGGQIYQAVPCSGVSANQGAESGAMVRTSTNTSYTCIQSQISFPSYDVPNATNGGHYCTALGQNGCTTANYYGRRGIPYIYYTFVASGRAECGFEYEPGAPNSSGGQSNPRWQSYIRDTAGTYAYGVNTLSPGTTATVWCGIESGHVEMKINGNFVKTSSGALLSSSLSFSGQSVHAMRLTTLAWPETAPKKVASAKATGSYFPAYTCQPLNQVGPVRYTSTLVCPSGSGTPSVPYVTSPGGNARWTSGGDGYTLSPTSEVSETQSGSTDTDLLFPGGG